MAKQGTKKGCEAEIAERKVRAFELRKKGYSYRDIAKEIKTCHQTAYNDVWDTIGELSEQAKKEGREYIQVEMSKLNDYLKSIAWKIDYGDYDAIKLAIKLHERMCRLMGIEVEKYAPTNPDGTEPYTGLIVLPEKNGNKDNGGKKNGNKA